MTLSSSSSPSNPTAIISGMVLDLLLGFEKQHQLLPSSLNRSIPSFRHIFKVLRSNSQAYSSLPVSKLSGMPSKCGTVFSQILPPHIYHTSSSFAGAITYWLRWTTVYIPLFWWWANSVAAISFRSHKLVTWGELCSLFIIKGLYRYLRTFSSFCSSEWPRFSPINRSKP